MENKARVLLLFASVAAVLFFVGCGGMMMTQNAIERTLPGDTFFGVRQYEETFPLAFEQDVTRRAAARMNLVAFRLNDLAARAGSAHEIDAVQSLDDAINQALVAIADVPANQRSAMLAQLALWMYGGDELLDKTGLAHNPSFMTKFDQKVAAIRDAGEKENIAPDYLRQLAVALPVTALPSSADSPALANLAPSRTVPAPVVFNHSYPLDGAHAKIECEKCHATGVYTGTPRDCIACHKDIHKPTLGRDCATCHTTKVWKPAKKN